MKKRIISLLLALIMALSLLPVSVLAADDHTGQVHVTVENTTWAKADKMDKDTRRLADSIIEEANRNNAIALPVGLAFAESLKERPDLVLHQADKSHPTAAGSYLYGALIYSLLFKASPEGLDFLGECEKTLRPEDAAYLQQLAWRVATEFYGWK